MGIKYFSGMKYFDSFRYIFTTTALLSRWTVGDQLDISKRTILPAMYDQEAGTTLIVPSPFIELTKNVYTLHSRSSQKKYVGCCRISVEACVWANFVSLSLTLRPKAGGGGVCAEKLMSQKTLMVTTLHLASDKIFLDYLDTSKASRKLFIPPTTNYQLKWCFSALNNLNLKTNFA